MGPKKIFSKILIIFFAQAYLTNIIENSSYSGDDMYATLRDNSKNLLKEYEKQVNLIKSVNINTCITVEEVFNLIEQLCELKHNGEKIKEMKDKGEERTDRVMKD